MNKMRIRDVDIFIKKKKTLTEFRFLPYNRLLILSLTTLIITSLSVFLISLINHPLAHLTILMFALVFIIGLNYLIFDFLTVLKERRYKSLLQEFLNNLRVHSYKSGDYKCLNYLLLDFKNFPDIALPLFYTFQQHFNGEWLQMNDIMCPLNYGEKNFFFKESFNFIQEKKNQGLNFDDFLNPNVFSEYINKLYPDRIIEFRNKGVPI